ncbi:response regulator [Spirochaeta thermophila]|uniref:Response regulator receiver protein n=2 Tax=Winmispira thermophila TaxID=154 RepID=G0GDZ2_WINT7|nr:response regulator [Spirochaeta thermophila]ADN01343.1 response regulator receiver protein [Spirochaeta thermophila DSM 6192]AEJ60624.1 response regulator receiver protein [Spirochaeta thermophila DSM 6578]
MAKTVLVVDDALLARKIARKILEKEGYQVEEAEGGQEAISMLEAQRPDVLLLDLLMPGMDGIQVLEELAKRRVSVPTIVVSADTQESTKQRCIQLGAKVFLNKPLTEEELKKALQEVSQ